MRRCLLGAWFAIWAVAVLSAGAQQRPYIGFVYPAGGQQGTTAQIRLGGQAIDDITGVLVTGKGVNADLAEYYRRLNNQEMQLLNEQLRMLRRSTLTDSGKATLMAETATTMSDMDMMSASDSSEKKPADSAKADVRTMMQKIEKRTSEFVQTPACPSIASLALVDVTISPDAEPGEREIRLVTLRGVSNPLPFYVGQLSEHSLKPMTTAIKQVLGKESMSLRRRLPGANEEEIALPCTLNGQIASGEVNRYRFEAKMGQKLVFSALGRELVPFIADAVPGWFQPVLALYDANGRELAYADDYRFKPDPTILYEVPKNGEYVLEIRDSLYRGREDFVYRITAGEVPFITGVFPLGREAGKSGDPQVTGWNVEGAELSDLSPVAPPGVHSLTATVKARSLAKGTRKVALVSNPVPYAIDPLPDALEREPNNDPATAQKISMPVIVNGRIDKPGDTDVFTFGGKAGETVAIEVQARRLESPLDSIVKLTDAAGKVMAFNDDREDLAAGLNTHHADSYLAADLPVDGTYHVHLSDTARQGGPEFGYRLRIGSPQPDFDLRTVPSSLSMRSRSSATLTVYVQRKDGFSGPIRLELKDPPSGFSASPVTVASTQTVARLTVRANVRSTDEPVSLSVWGTAKMGDRTIARQAVPAEDRMQAFLWRHLVPARELVAVAYDPSTQLPNRRAEPPKRTLPPTITNAAPTLAASAGTNSPVSATNAVPSKPKFTPQQIAGRLRQLRLLFNEGMLTDDFYAMKVAECEAEQ